MNKIPAHKVVIIEASAGGLEALTELFRRLPADLPITVLVALHYPPKGKSLLANILDKRSQMSASLLAIPFPTRA